jgi:hypothetical protein
MIVLPYTALEQAALDTLPHVLDSPIPPPVLVV